MRKVLFLCSGNYYRSRFAEAVFNQRAERAGLAWRADSRAVDLAGSRPWIRGPISPYCIEALSARGIVVRTDVRHPIQAAEADLLASDVVVALKEAEHRARIESLFPAQAGRVEYWHIHDIDCARPEESLPELETAIGGLIERLSRAETPAAS